MSKMEQEFKHIFSRYEKLGHLRSLETAWDKIYDSNPDLSPYQSFAFNRVVQSVSRLSPRRITLSPRFFVFYNLQDEVRLIAPLYVRGDHEGRRVYLFTDRMPAGYTDLIYPSDLTQQEFDMAISVIGRELNDPLFVFHKVNQDSQLNRFVQQGALDLQESSHQICVEISVQESYHMYWEGLSKSTRQNIRTSRNRLERDGREWDVELLQGDRLSRRTVRTIMDIYFKRYAERGYAGLRSMLLGFSKRHLNPVTRALRKSTNSFCAILKIDGNPVAFCAGFERPGGCIAIPFLSIDGDWRQYSPGGLLITEIMKQLHVQKSHMSLDLSRGGEEYKYRYGGLDHFNYNYIFRIRE